MFDYLYNLVIAVGAYFAGIFKGKQEQRESDLREVVKELKRDAEIDAKPRRSKRDILDGLRGDN